MLTSSAFQGQPMLVGDHVRLEPLTTTLLESYLLGLNDAEVRRLTGTQAVCERSAVRTWLATLTDHDDRADWAVIRSSDDAFLGETVLSQLDAENASVSYRIWLSGIEATDRGYGTERSRG